MELKGPFNCTAPKMYFRLFLLRIFYLHSNKLRFIMTSGMKYVLYEVSCAHMYYSDYYPLALEFRCQKQLLYFSIHNTIMVCFPLL